MIKLNVAVISYNSALTIEAINHIGFKAEDLSARRINEKTIEVSDGTRYFAITDIRQTYGIVFDQIIIVDDVRNDVLFVKGGIIENIRGRLSTVVPEGFKVQILHW